MVTRGRNFLCVPGPTNVPHRVVRALQAVQEDHRSPSFPSLTLPILRDLPTIFQSASGRCFVFPCSGTGAWEVALCNTLSPGDKVLAPRFGQFSHLWVDMAQRLGLDVQVLDSEWGTGAPLDRIAEACAADTQHQIKAVLIVHNETTTGVTSDIGGVREALDAAAHPALLFVDGVSSIGALDFRMDEWRVDCAVTGSQKALMLPAGLGIVCASPRALAAGERARLARVFFDFRDHIAANATGYFPYTPSVPMLHGLRESISMLLEEGLDAVFVRHRHLAEGVRTAVKAWGLELCARAATWHSDTVSAVMMPDGVDGKEVIARAYQRYNLSLGGGLARMNGRLFRIGHMGDINELMLLGAIAGAEMAMRDVGLTIQPGSGVAAAEEYWRRTSVETTASRPVAALAQPAAAAATSSAASGM